MKLDYMERYEDNWDGVETSQRCRRVSRGVIDCTTSILVWSWQSGCVADPGNPAYDTAPETYECEAGATYETWWRVSDGLANQALGGRLHRPELLPPRPHASTDPTTASAGAPCGHRRVRVALKARRARGGSVPGW